MAADTTDLAILFADISGSTRLYDEFGDVRAREIVADTLSTLASVVRVYDGGVIKTIGDEIMCTVADAERAAQAAIDMHEAIEAQEIPGEAQRGLSIRIGFHYGPALLENGDVYGDAVNVAARMAAQAKAGQIVTTRVTSADLSPELREMARFVDYAPIKGKGEVAIDELLWQHDESTQMATGVRRARFGEEPSSLTLHYRGDSLVLDPERTEAVLGRSASCDIKVHENLASREHVRVELRRDKFFVTDQSTNGTYVRDADGAISFLRREQMPFTRDVDLSLGRAFSDEPDQLVHCAYGEASGGDNA
jgi:hypothetical protein